MTTVTDNMRKIARDALITEKLLDLAEEAITDMFCRDWEQGKRGTVEAAFSQGKFSKAELLAAFRQRLEKRCGISCKEHT